MLLLLVAALAACSFRDEEVAPFAEGGIGFEVPQGQLAEFECFGRSFAFWFILDGRALQAHVSLGVQEDVAREQEAIALPNSLTVDRS